jgi:hypothetical protein
MNKRQKDILQFLSTQNPSEFITPDVISVNTGITMRVVGSECAKLEKEGYIQHGNSQLGVPLNYRITTSGQNYLDEESQKIKNFNISSKTAYATIILACATVGLAIVTLSASMDTHAQTDLMRKDFDVNNRPWIGGLNFTVSHGAVVYDYQNFGKIPNSGGQIVFLVSTSPITRDMLKSNMTKTIPMQILMPSEKLTSIFSGSIGEGIKSAQDGKSDLYLGVSFTYEYVGNKSGDYNIISHYNPKDNSMDLIDSWID